MWSLLQFSSEMAQTNQMYQESIKCRKIWTFAESIAQARDPQNFTIDQRIYITRRRDSNILLSYKHLTHPTSPCLLCWQLYRRTGSAVYCMDRKRLGESHLCKMMAGAVPSITNIYSLATSYRLTNIWLTQPLPALSPVYCTTCPSV